MLGAPDDDEGIRKPTINLGEPLTLPTTLEVSITRSVEGDPWLWCVRLVLSKIRLAEFYTDGWMQCSTIRPSPEHEVTISDATMASVF